MFERAYKPLKVEDVINLPKQELKNFITSPWTIVGGVGGIIFAGGMIVVGEANIAALHLKMQQTMFERWWPLFLSPYGGGSLGYLGEKIWGETKNFRDTTQDYILKSTANRYNDREKSKSCNFYRKYAKFCLWKQRMY
ncbi:hypothetical protein HYW46_03860 [Candidatus Daviesbacteria bacterium]|nr:hypothetical protein [Candidatus Daviesbacteria bacterium]